MVHSNNFRNIRCWENFSYWEVRNKYIYNILKYRFLVNEFSLQKLATIGIENRFQCVQLGDGSIIKLRVMDTAGQELFNAINENYYQQADCCLLVYAINSKESFEKIKDYYVVKIKEKCKKDLKVVLLGNKTDLENEREVSKEDGRDLALANGYMFMESSCKDNYNVSDAFTALVEMTNTEYSKKMFKADTFGLKKDKKSEKSNKKKDGKGGCC